MKPLARDLTVFPWHTFLVPISFCIALFSINQNRLEIYETISTLAIVTLMTATVVVLLRVLIGDWAKSGVIASILACYIFYSPVLGSTLLGEAIPQGAQLAMIGIIVIFAIRWVQRSVADFRRAAATLNLAFLLLPVAPIAHVLEFQIDSVKERPLPKDLFADIPVAAKKNDRDIWHLVFDRYADGETLKSVYGYDNEAFLNGLEQRGFVVPRNSAANYQRTAHSLASVFNLDYLTPLSEKLGGANGDWVPVYRLLTDNRVSRFFKNQDDYHFVHLGSWWNPTRLNPFADENRNYRDISEFSRALLNNTVVGRILFTLGVGPSHGRADQCARIKHKFDELEVLATDPRKKFVTAHMLIPHPPYVLDELGNCVDLQEVETRTREQNYLGQLEYANKRLMRLVDMVLAHSEKPPIIILQADEGPWPKRIAGDERFVGRDAPPTDWSRVNDGELREKMRILNALYLPGAKNSIVTDNFTPVNTFRLVLDLYFGTNLGTLPNRNFIFVSDEKLYSFKEVSDRVQRNNLVK